MRIASSPNARIDAGLLLAVLLSVVGYQVVRRLKAHGPEALLKRADGLVWLIRVDLPELSYRSRDQRIHSLLLTPNSVAARAHSHAMIRSHIAAVRHDSAVGFPVPSRFSLGPVNIAHATDKSPMTLTERL